MRWQGTPFRLPLSTEYYILIALAVGAFLMLVIPDDLYGRSDTVRMLTDTVATAIPCITEFARISNVPGTTRVTLALLWLSVPPVAVALGFSSKTFRRKAWELRRVGLRPFLKTAGLIAITVFLLPYLLKVPPHFESKLSWDAELYRLVAQYPLVMGMVGALYCYLCALMLGGLGRSIILVARYRPDESHPS